MDLFFIGKDLSTNTTMATTYIPPNAAGFFPEGTSSKTRQAFFQECMQKEKNFAYRAEEMQKRFDLMQLLPADIAALDLPENLAGISPRIITKLLIPRDGWQSSHFALLFENSNGMLIERLAHLSDWITQNGIPSNVLAEQEAYAAEQQALRQKEEETRLNYHRQLHELYIDEAQKLCGLAFSAGHNAGFTDANFRTLSAITGGSQ